MNRLTLILVCSLLAAPAAAELLSKRSFTRQFAEALRAEAPGIEVRITGDTELAVKDASGNDGTVYLDNAYATYSADPTARKDIVQRYVRAALETMNKPPQVDRTRIVPMVKDRGWLAEIRAAAKARGAKDPDHKVFDDLNEDLVIVYAEDTPRNIRYLTPDDLSELGIKKAQLRRLAVDNLRNLLPDIELRKGPLVSMITAGGDYEASLLLLDNLWVSDQLAVEGEIIVAIPARDVLLFTGSKQRGGVAKLRELASQISGKASYRLTDRLFVYRSGRFQRYE